MTLALGSLVVALSAMVTAQSAPPTQAPPGGVEGPFTEAQAARGKEVYARTCAACHGPDLQGATAIPLVGTPFQARWRFPALTIDDLFYVVRKTMPPGGAGTVPLDDLAAVVAHVLQANGARPGSQPLAVGARALIQALPWAGKYVSALGEPAAATGPDLFPADAGALPGTHGPDQAALDNAVSSKDWLVHTHDYAGTRHSPLAQIDTSNANRLAPACLFQVGEAGGFQAGPIVHAGTLYLTTPRSTIAIDAATCRVRWRHTWQLRGDASWNRSRGVAIKDGRVVRGTPDGYLLALSSETGGMLWARRVADGTAGETFSMAPIIYDDLILIGPAGSENNIRGWVGAFRASDGSPVWRFNTVPRPGEPGHDTWQNPKGIPMGGGAIWTSFSLDTATGELHIAVTNPAPDLPAHLRPGTNLYTNSILVLDVRTGKYRWHRSLVPSDSHDWDLTHATPLFSATVNGVRRRLVATAGKDGFVRALDRESHDIVYATPVTTIENADVPVTTTPTHACPGVLGGVQWNGPAHNAATNMIYVPAVDRCGTFTADAEPRYIPGKNYLGGTVTQDPIEKAQGWLTALDASTGAVRWKYRSSRPMVAAVTTTAGQLVLAGEMTGDFIVLDARTGDVLYRFNTGGPMGGGIVTYEVAGRQYIAVSSGAPSANWPDPNGGAPTIVVFALPAM